MHNAIYHLRCRHCGAAYLSVPGKLTSVCFACDQVDWQLLEVWLRPRTPWVDAPGHPPRLLPLQTAADFLARLAWLVALQDMTANVQRVRCVVPGLLGHVTARAEAQVLRLSCLYALLDQSATVTIDHLNAALAFWRYCEDSAVYIFGDALGDAVADEILHMLRAIAPNSMTRTDIYNAFDRHKTSANIQQALTVLLRQQFVTYTKEDTPGRPVERWSARLVSASAYAQKAY